MVDKRHKIIWVRVLLLAIALLWPGTLAFAQGENARGDVPATSDAIERDRLQLEKDRLAFEKTKQAMDEQLERDRLGVERESAIWAAFGTMIPLLTALAALWVSLRNQARQAELQHQQAEAQFQLKAAELVVGVTDPHLAHSRAVVLRNLFPQRFPADFEAQFEPGKFTNAIYEDWQTVAKLISEHPENKKMIAETWLKIFPGDPKIAAMGQCSQPSAPSRSDGEGASNPGHQTDG
jgi:hypothetical protein